MVGTIFKKKEKLRKNDSLGDSSIDRGCRAAAWCLAGSRQGVGPRGGSVAPCHGLPGAVEQPGQLQRLRSWETKVVLALRASNRGGSI